VDRTLRPDTARAVIFVPGHGRRGQRGRRAGISGRIWPGLGWPAERRRGGCNKPAATRPWSPFGVMPKTDPTLKYRRVGFFKGFFALDIPVMNGSGNGRAVVATNEHSQSLRKVEGMYSAGLVPFLRASQRSRGTFETWLSPTKHVSMGVRSPCIARQTAGLEPRVGRAA